MTSVPANEPVLSGVVGTNRDLIATARRLWIAPNDIVADVTWGKGAFWPKGLADSDQPQFRYDVATTEVSVDCRALPNETESLDVVVFDPPYRPNHGGDQTDFYRHYRLAESGLNSMNDVLDLYQGGIREAHRVLRSGGRVLVKCQDMTYSDRLHLVHLDVVRLMQAAGFDFVDMFVLVNTTRRPSSAAPASAASEGEPEAPRRSQKRARRAHSYLLVGSKPSRDLRIQSTIERLRAEFGDQSVLDEINRQVATNLADGSDPAQ
ncbi:MAG: DNA methyltransferase [Pseudolysinimonas sp.]